MRVQQQQGVGAVPPAVVQQVRDNWGVYVQPLMTQIEQQMGLKKNNIN